MTNDESVNNLPEPMLPERRGNELAIVTLVLDQMGKMEQRLGDAIKTHSDAETKRWERHERDHARDAELFISFANHLEAEEDAVLVMRTRLEPVKKAGHIIRREWRLILIIVMVVINLVAQVDLHAVW